VSAGSINADETPNVNPTGGKTMLELDPKTTAPGPYRSAKSIIGHELTPHRARPGLEVGTSLPDTFRKAGAPVVLGECRFRQGFQRRLETARRSAIRHAARRLSRKFRELIDGLAKPGDILITSRQWGAFHGTELDLQLRRRGIQTIVLGGVATNIGVESTARQAWEHGYAVVLAEDATSGMSAQMHDFAIGNIFPRISRVVKVLISRFLSLTV